MNPQKKMVYMQKLFNPRSSSNGLSSLNKDNFVRVMVESINKAINTTEGPVKEKHVRRLLIGTYQIESGNFFWLHLPVIKLQENQIVCWKFCHVLHKMLRDGHQRVLTSSHERRQVLLDCGNMWRHVGDGYGQLIYKYCTLLYNRTNFLMRNPGFPNDLRVTDAQLDEIGNNDPNIFFDLSCELFDALDDILRLQELVLVKINCQGLNSMSASGQCHLAPLVMCIQDSSLIYDYTVKILFKLHESLPASTLEGHRSRFLCQHNSLKSFYVNTSNLQYFKTLIQIPHLTDKPPNFLVASDLQQHVAPQVIMISNPERESPDQLLVDLNDDDESSTGDLSLPEASSSMQSFQETTQTSSSNNNNKPSSPDLPEKQTSAVADSTIGGDVDEASFANSNQRLQEIETLYEQLRGELVQERADHEETCKRLQSEVDQAKSELTKIHQQLTNFKHQAISSKNAYDKLMEEFKRAQHDAEISRVAMKKVVKEMSELRCKNHDEQMTVKEVQLEVDTREEDLLVAEMSEIEKILKGAAQKIEELAEKSRRLETGTKLEVNEKISEVCTSLMKAVRNLIAQSRLLQKEIVQSSLESGPAAAAAAKGDPHRYKLKSDWIDGLVSAANVVAMAARSLVDAADRSMSGLARFTELGAAAHEIAAATTQLVVASRVKAKRESEKLKLLETAAKQVNQCALSVVEASRVCAQLMDQQEVDAIDISTLSLHQTKKLEMESQVKLLELEMELSKERVRLGNLRRRHYEEEEKALQQNNESEA